MCRLINKLADEILNMYLTGLIFGFSKRILKEIAKQLKEICKEIDSMIKEGLVQLDLTTSMNFELLIKGFVDSFDKEEKIQFIRPPVASLSECMKMLYKFANLLQNEELDDDAKIQIIALIIDLIKQALEFLKSEPKNIQKAVGQQLLEIIKICKNAQTGISSSSPEDSQELESLEKIIKKISKDGISDDNVLIVNLESSEDNEHTGSAKPITESLKETLKPNNSPANQS